MDILFFVVTGLAYFVFILTLIVKNIKRIDKISKGLVLWRDLPRQNWITFLFVVIAPITASLKLYYFSDGGNFIFGHKHSIALLLIYTVSCVSFYLSKCSLYKGNVSLYWFSRVGIIQGIILCLLLLAHFNIFSLVGAALPIFGFELIAPLLAILFFIKELQRSRLEMLELAELKPEEEGADNIYSNLLNVSILQRGVIILSILSAILLSEELIIIATAPSPVSAILSFTESESYFLFSSHFDFLHIMRFF